MIYGLLITWATMAVVIALTGVTLWNMPNGTRPSLFFAVTVLPEFRQTPEAAEITGDYRRRVRLHTGLAAVLLLISGGVALTVGDRPAGAIALIAGALLPLIWLGIGSLSAMLAARRRVLPHAIRPTRVREVALRPCAPGRSDALMTVLTVAGPSVLLIAAAVYLLARWNDIPLRFPVHWGFSGQPDGWASRTPMGVFGPLIIAAGMYIPYLILVWGVRRARRVATIGSAAATETRFRLWTQAALLTAGNAMIALLAMLAIWLPFRNAETLPVGAMAIMLSVELALAAVIIGLCLRAGQGGHRLLVPRADPLSTDVAAAVPPIGDGTLDEHWIAGLLYCNRDDPAVLVEKRFGIGWTFNMARLATYLILLGLLLPGIVVVAVVVLTSDPVREKNRSEVQPTDTAAAMHVAFINDPELIGSWRSLDFVDEIAEFNPAALRSRGELFFKGMDIRANGETSVPGWRWSKGRIVSPQHPSHPARYEMRQIDGRPYLFFEWISGDVTIRGMKPRYYVLEKSRPEGGRQ